MALNILYSLSFLFIIVFSVKEIIPYQNKAVNTKNLFIGSFILVFVIKILFGYYGSSFDTDIALFKAWGSYANQIGFNNMYYQDTLYLDYPPAYLYVLAFMDKIRTVFAIDYNSQLYTLLIKLPAIIADMACGYLIYKISKKRFDSSSSVLFSILYMLNPLIVLDSSIWGQMDSVCALFIVISLILLKKNRFILGGTCFGIGVLLKPQMLIFVPVFVLYAVFKKEFYGLLYGITSALVAIVALSLPFSQNLDFSFLISTYTDVMGYYNYYTINAYNVFALFGLNWGALPENTILLTVLGPVVATALTGIYLFKNKDKNAIFPASALIISTVFMFTIKMHERYMFTIAILLLLSYIYYNEKRFLYVFTAFSISNFLNIAYILYLNNSYISPTSPQIILLSLLNVLIYIYFVYVLFSKSKKQIIKPKSINRVKEKKSPSYKLDNTPKINTKFAKKDFIAITAISLFYALFAFYNLGDTETANTSWTPTAGESITYTISGDYDTMIYMSGIGASDENTPISNSNFLIEGSYDGEEYIYLFNMGETSFTFSYEWLTESVISGLSYIRITALDNESILNEISLVNTANDTQAILSPLEGENNILTDEQNIVPIYSDYLNSTYFDEIYHARTAYELILGVEPYENTHPHLGKLIIALSITIFGMNPFGWRFAGALFGILMLPLLYFIIKKLTGCTKFASFGTFLFAFDFMHFTQTRIATIDTYAVFFILAMFAAMLVFLQKDIMTSSYKSLFIPLGISGILMGLGISAKWTCAYGAVGLAVLYFTKIISAYIKENDKDLIFKKIKNLCFFCVGFFIIIPFSIYFISFLPVTTLPQNADNIWSSFINYQIHMYEYHANLVATHSFSSPWYEWPLTLQNIWYAVTYNVDGTELVSSISCLGNPLLYIITAISVLIAIYKLIRTKNMHLYFVIVGFMSVYLPWVLVERISFIYHYFTAVPFAIMAFFCLLNPTTKSYIIKNKFIRIKTIDVPLIGLCAICFIMFLIFYPAISGAPTTIEYLNSLEWFPDWYFI